METPESVSPHITPFIRKPPSRLPVTRPYHQAHSIVNDVRRGPALTQSKVLTKDSSSGNGSNESGLSKGSRVTTTGGGINQSQVLTKDSGSGNGTSESGLSVTTIGDGMKQSKSVTKDTSDTNSFDESNLSKSSAATTTGNETVHGQEDLKVQDGEFAEMLKIAGIPTTVPKDKLQAFNAFVDNLDMSEYPDMNMDSFPPSVWKEFGSAGSDQEDQNGSKSAVTGQEDEEIASAVIGQDEIELQDGEFTEMLKVAGIPTTVSREKWDTFNAWFDTIDMSKYPDTNMDPFPPSVWKEFGTEFTGQEDEEEL